MLSFVQAGAYLHFFTLVLNVCRQTQKVCTALNDTLSLFVCTELSVASRLQRLHTHMRASIHVHIVKYAQDLCVRM